jgi:predicted ATPase
VRALSFLSHDLFMLGHLDQALSHSEQSVLWSRTLRHSHSLAYALSHGAALHLFRRDEQAAVEALEEAAAIATEHEFPLWLAYSKIMRGHVLVTRGETVRGLELARSGQADMKATGAFIVETWRLSLLAKCCELADQPDEASGLLTRALEMSDRSSERFFEAELHRQRGEWLLAHCRSEHAEAEACFQRALAIAQGQGARIWQLRAAASLSRLWREQGKRAEARDLLAPVCGWFTEGLDTPDLKEAKALLNELAG